MKRNPTVHKGRVSRRSRPRPKRPVFSSLRGAASYATGNNWPIIEHVSTLNGDRLNVITKSGPRTLRIKKGATS